MGEGFRQKDFRFRMHAEGLDKLAVHEIKIASRIWSNRGLRDNMREAYYDIEAHPGEWGKERVLRAAANAQLRINRIRQKIPPARFREEAVAIPLEEAFRAAGFSAQIKEDVRIFERLHALSSQFPLPVHPRVRLKPSAITPPSPAMKRALYALIRSNLKGDISVLKTKRFVKAFYDIYVSLLADVSRSN